MLNKFFEFYEAHKSYFVMALVMFAIVMTFGTFGEAGLIIGAFVAVACAVTKEIYDVKHGGKASGFDVGAYMIGLIAGLIITSLRFIA